MRKQKSREARGYGSRHRRMREILAIEVELGIVACAKCGELIEPGTPFHLGHNDDRTAWTGAEHAACNLRDAGKKGYAAMRANLEAENRSAGGKNGNRAAQPEPAKGWTGLRGPNEERWSREW